MDRLYRLSVLTVITCFALVWFGLGKAFAQQYEYTGKTQGNTPVAKVNGWICTANDGIGPSVVKTSTVGHYQACLAAAIEDNGCGARGGAYGTAVVGIEYRHPSYWVQCNNAQYIGGTNGFYNGWVTSFGPAQVCPADSVEVGGQCYSLECPSDSPPWQPDPNDSSQCRREVQCPWPQRNGQNGCECGIGRQTQFVDGGGGIGLGLGITAVKSVTGQVGMPASMCLVDGSNHEGCEVLPDTAAFNGTRTVITGGYFTGQTCTGSDNANSQEQAQDKKCPVGQVVGHINGSSICVEGGTTETKHPTKTETSTKTNPDGTTEETTTTTECSTHCVGGNCEKLCTVTKTTVTKDGQGNPTGTTTEETNTRGPGGGRGGDGDGDGSGESSFGGSCPSFACQGDAVQCAIALEQHKRNCELLEDKGGLTREAAVEAFEEALQFDDDQLTTQTAFGSISGRSFLSGACVQDLSVTVWGEVIAIPFSSLCPYLQAMGAAFLAVCSVLAFRIVAGGVM